MTNTRELAEKLLKAKRERELDEARAALAKAAKWFQDRADACRTLATAHLASLDEVERLKEAAKSLEDVLCDPEGNASIVGSNGDMAVINAALSAFRRI